MPSSETAPVYTGRAVDAPVTVVAFDYGTDAFEQVAEPSPDCLARLRDTERPTWVQVDGIHDPSVITRVGQAFGLHPLVVEDVVNVHQRPKVEDYGDYLFCPLKMVRFDRDNLALVTEQFSLVLGRNYVLTFAECEGEMFAPVAEALRHDRGLIRRSGPDYLAYRLVDQVVDQYFRTIEQLGDLVGELEDLVLADSSADVLARVHLTKRALMQFRRSLWPMREVVGELLRGANDLVSDNIRVYLRDVYDHVVEVMEMLEMDLGTASGLHDLYLTCLGQRTNEAMKTLTVIATVILPMGLVPAIYGQNLKMPESSWVLGYPWSLGLMALVAVSMLTWLRRRALV